MVRNSSGRLVGWDWSDRGDRVVGVAVPGTAKSRGRGIPQKLNRDPEVTLNNGIIQPRSSAWGILEQGMDILRSVRPLLAGMICLGGAFQGWSQQVSPNPAGGAHRIAVGTEVVRVPAIVTDRSGAHVPDLSIEDFTILENGKPQKIAFFEHIQTKPELLKPQAASGSEVTNTYEKSPGRL